MKRFSIWSGVVIVTAFISTSPLWAQKADTEASPKSFEVISIKRSNTNESHRALTISPGGRFTATDTTLKGLIMMAYNVGPDRLSGATGWMESERFDVIATAPEGAIKGSVGRQGQWTGPNGQSAKWTSLSANTEGSRRIREMLQSLLSDRFQLKLHRETKELPVYDLVVAKEGPKLHESKSENLHMQAGGGIGDLSFQGTPMSTLATTLTWMTGRPVLDKTGLSGNYDFTLNWTPDENQMQTLRGGSGGAGNNLTPASEPSGPSLFTAVQEQLGLRLVPTKGPVEVFIVDHAEKPSEN